MVLPAQVDSIHIHPAIISPVVRQRDNQLNPRPLGSPDNLVEWFEVNHRRAVVPPLEDDLGCSGAFAAIIREAPFNGCDVFIIEPPCAEDIEAGFLCGGEAEFDVGLVLGC